MKQPLSRTRCGALAAIAAASMLAGGGGGSTTPVRS